MEIPVSEFEDGNEDGQRQRRVKDKGKGRAMTSNAFDGTSTPARDEIDEQEEEVLRVIYRHYATLYFVFCVDEAESELGILDLIQVRLQRFFEWAATRTRSPLPSIRALRPRTLLADAWASITFIAGFCGITGPLFRKCL